MKRKILLSLVVLMLSCLVCFGAVGCDERAETLTVTAGTIEFVKYVEQNSNASNGYKSYSDFIEEEIAEGLKVVTKIELKNSQDPDKNDEWSSYEEFHKDGGRVTGINLRNKEGGTYELVFSFNGVDSEPITYTIVEKRGSVQQKVHGSGTGQHAFEDKLKGDGTAGQDGNCDYVTDSTNGTKCGKTSDK